MSCKKEKIPRLSTKERKAKLLMAVKEFNDELLNLVTIQNEMEKLNTIRYQQVIEIDEMYDKIEEFKELIEYSTISPAKNNNKGETVIKMLRISKAELERKQDLITQEEFETGEIFLDLYHKRRRALEKINFISLKLEKLGVSKIKTDAVKESNNLVHSSWWCCFNIK